MNNLFVIGVQSISENVPALPRASSQIEKVIFCRCCKQLGI